jgi:3-hydroxybutyryl-CoA dehydrogenase
MAPPHTVIATPTLHQSIGDLASCTNRREKCIAIAAAPDELAAGAGADLLLRAAPFTSDETAALLVDFFRRLGFRPVVERTTA